MSLEIDALVRVSNYPDQPGGSKTFGFHDAEITVRMLKESGGIFIGPLFGGSLSPRRVHTAKHQAWYGLSIGYRH